MLARSSSEVESIRLWSNMLPLLLASILLASGCSDSSLEQVPTPQTTQTLPENDGAVYLPLVVGMKTKAVVEVEHSNGSIESGHATMAISEKKMINGHEYYAVSREWEGVTGFQDLTNYYRPTDLGIAVIAGESDDETLELPLDISLGHRWTASHGAVVMTYEVTKEEHAFNVRGNEFADCIRIDFSWTGCDGYNILAPQIGVIYSTFTTEAFKATISAIDHFDPSQPSRTFFAGRPSKSK